ncbi:hypothetical protein ACOTJG_26190 [Achromobacter xylosoxidans]|jgi:hypothetical protein
MTIVIGGTADGKIVPAGPSDGTIPGIPDEYILVSSKKGGDKRYFYLLASLRGTDWENRALEVWEKGTPAALIEASPSRK